MIKFGLLLWFASVASIGLKYFDSIMIGKYMPLSFVGIYTIAAFIPTVIEAPINAFEKIAAAKISFAYTSGDKTLIYNIYHKSSLFMFLAGGFLFVNIIGNIHTLFRFLPAGYEQGEIVVLIISIGTLFNMATGLNMPILFNSDKYRYGAFYLIFLAILVLILQMVFIRMFGLAGAALATCTASLVYNFLLFISVYKFFGLQPFDRKNLLVLMIVIFVSTIIYVLPHLENKYYDIAARTAIISTLYLGLVYFARIVPEFHKYIPFLRNKE
jgi:O-antigen/teichoic acid export membrane protein